MAYRTDRPLDHPMNWSFRIGRLFGIDVRIHVLLVLAALMMVVMEVPWRQAGSFSAVRAFVDGLGSYALLFTLVLIHEFGHCFGARFTGGEADEILLWPLGGLAMTRPPHNPAAHMITTLAGPLTNVIICAITSVVLVQWTGRLGAVPWNPLQPFTPVDSTVFLTEVQHWVLRGFGVSYLLLVLNMAPVFPFDGGRVLQAWLWPRRGFRESTMIASSIGLVGAVVLGVVAFCMQAMILLLAAVFGYTECRRMQERLREEGEYDLGDMEYELAGGRDATDGDSRKPKRAGMLDRWRRRRAAAKAERERAKHAAHEQAVEDVLAKVSKSGMGSLTTRERRVLEEETRRQRALRDEARRSD